MPKRLTCNFAVEYVPLPENRVQAWWYGMELVNALMHAELEKQQAAGLEISPLGPDVGGTGAHARQLEIV